jgi:hypothetical protein
MIPDWLKPPFDYLDPLNEDHIMFLVLFEVLEQWHRNRRTKHYYRVIDKRRNLTAYFNRKKVRVNE